MSLLTDVLGIANEVTAGLELQATVGFRRDLGDDGYGDHSFASSVDLRCVVERKTRMVRTPSGQEVVSSATLTFLDLAALLAATPATTTSTVGVVALGDEITVMGRVQPILNVGGFVDGGSGRMIPTEVYLG